MSISEKLERCRLMLVVRCEGDGDQQANIIADALSGGDVASIILAPAEDEIAFVDQCRAIVPVAQKHGIAVIIANDSQIMGRSGADGLHVDNGNSAIKEAVDKFSPQKIVGAAGIKTRHNALTVGEFQPDYVFFGKVSGDTHPEPHKKNIALAEWWSSLVEIPCVVMGGTALESCIAVAQCGAEFVALSSAIFLPDSDGKADVGSRVARVNELLDEFAPSFEEIE